MGQWPGCPSPRPGITVPQSRAMEQRSLREGLAWPAGRIISSPCLAPPWHQPREPVLLLTLDVLWSRMPPPRRGLAAWQNASRGGRVLLPGPSGTAPRGGPCRHCHQGPAQQRWPRRKCPRAERGPRTRVPSQAGDPRSDTTASGRRCLGPSSPWSSCSCSPGGPLSSPSVWSSFSSST